MWLNIIAVVVTSHMHFAHFFSVPFMSLFFPLRHWDQCGWRWIRVIGTANPSCPPDIASFIVRPSIVPSFYQFIRFNYDPQKYKEQEEGPTRAWSRWSEAGQKQSLKQFPVLNSILQTLTFLYNLLQFNQYDFFFLNRRCVVSWAQTQRVKKFSMNTTKLKHCQIQLVDKWSTYWLQIW